MQNTHIFNKKALFESMDHIQKAIDIFGTTYYKTRAGFILTNGKMLDLTYGGGPREDHRNIQDAFDDMNLDSGSDYLIEFMNEGNIRCIPEIPGIDLVKDPNEAQWKTLKDYIEFWVAKKHYFVVQLSDANGNQIWGKDYEGFVKAEDILCELHNMVVKNQDKQLQKDLNEVYPQKGETKSDFINRFMRATAKEYPDVKQRYAVAYSYWNRRNLKEAIQNDTFNIKKTGVGKYDEWLSSQVARDRDNVDLEFKYMTPREYFEACGQLFNNDFNSQVRQIENDKNINKELDKVYDSNEKMNLTLLDYVSDPPTQEGRHRMYVLAQKYGWDENTYPVAVFTVKDPERAEREKEDKRYDRIYKYIDKAVMKALDFTYRDYDELKQQLDYYLEDYLENPDIKISERGSRLIISQDNVDYEINKNEFDWDYDKHLNLDDIKFDDIIDIDDLEEEIQINSKTDFIVNPEANKELADKLQAIIASYKNTVLMKRDNCLWINRNLKNYLEESGYKAELTGGYFIVDNLNIVDTEDLKYLKCYNAYRASGKSIPEFVKDNNYCGKELGWFTYVPHWWLELDGLIIDRAWLMFRKALEKPITSANYSSKDFNEGLKLTEETRGQLIAKSRNSDLYKNKEFGKNRFERKRLSKVANQVKSFNQINMDKFFKQDLLELNIPVIGETDTYTVTIALEGVCAEIAKNIKNNNNKFEFKVVLQAVTKIFNSSNNVRVKCTCGDFRFRFAHQMILNGTNVDGTDKDPGPGKTGMANTQGRGCKHILAVLNNASWIMKVASVINNYVNYAQEHMQKAFMKLIFPKLYGMPVDAAIEADLVPEDTNLDTEKHIIDVINDWAKNRGKYRKGENRNPVNDKRNKA